ncbi:MAG TPA: hypothetical protein PKK23_14670 [Nitrospirales bacterium]|nr:hypothetical protein [Nitrospiraceae bacterium]HNP30287.1 hypothetical protein [Nitrospirales bacterium]
MPNRESFELKDWVSDSYTYAFLWGLPGALLIVGVFVDPFTRTIMWTGALLWKGVACVVNAARCGRTHCYFTGPYFLLLAIVMVLHGFQIVDLGANGWMWLGLALIGGTGFLWIVTERIWGKFFPANY